MEHETEYVQIMLDSLKKKVDILNQITVLNEEQKNLIRADVLDLEAFDVTVEKKGECIDTLTNLDSGFQKLYDRVKEALDGKRDTYKPQIQEMQDLISKIMQLSMSIQAEEERNKDTIKAHFTKLKKEVYQIKNSQKVAQNYYNSMNKLNFVDPQFLDKKK
ncbi:MAG: flagellar export chaperone FlgN [Lachnospiraceae bacterium]|nr:flagellar export chaperone FlgN [Lachnospiraceae bacterium]